MDLTKEFLKISEEDGWIVIETNQPNDQHGDQAFEWDIDGNKRKRWEEYLKELDAKGTRGDLVYTKWRIQKNDAFDTPSKLSESEYPISSYKMIIFDTSE